MNHSGAPRASQHTWTRHDRRSNGRSRRKGSASALGIRERWRLFTPAGPSTEGGPDSATSGVTSTHPPRFITLDSSPWGRSFPREKCEAVRTRERRSCVDAAAKPRRWLLAIRARVSLLARCGRVATLDDEGRGVLGERREALAPEQLGARTPRASRRCRIHPDALHAHG